MKHRKTIRKTEKEKIKDREDSEKETCRKKKKENQGEEIQAGNFPKCTKTPIHRFQKSSKPQTELK